MKRTNLYGKDCNLAIGTILDLTKIMAIEFTTELEHFDTIEEMERYLINLENKKFLTTHYISYADYGDCVLFKFRDSIGNQTILRIEREF